MDNDKLQKVQQDNQKVRDDVVDFYRKIPPIARNFNNQIMVLNAINNRHFNSNADKAAALYKELRLKAPSGIQYRPLLSELEIRNLLNEKDSVKKLCGKLTGILREVEELDRKTFKWQLRIQNAMISFRLYKQIKDKPQQQSYQNLAKASIREMKEAKKAMNEVMSLMENLNTGNPFPIVRDVIGFYLKFFKSTDEIFNLAESYANNIIDLTEEVLGENGECMKNVNDINRKDAMDRAWNNTGKVLFEQEWVEKKRH